MTFDLFKSFGIRLLPLVAVASISIFSHAADAALTRSLFLGAENDDDVVANVMTNLIGSDARFDHTNSASMDLMTSGTPSLSDLQQFNSVLVWTNFPPADPTGLSDVLGQYVSGGGRVVIATFWGQQVGGGAGNVGLLNSPGYNPLTNPRSDAYSPASLGAYDASDPLMQGVTSLYATTYRGDYNTDLDNGARIVAFWDDGQPLEAVNGPGNVIDITLYPNTNSEGFSDGGAPSGDYARLFANALATDPGMGTDVPEPASLVLFGAGLAGLGAIRRRTAG